MWTRLPILALLLAAIATALVACGDAEKEAEPAATEEAAASETPETTETGCEKTAAPAAREEKTRPKPTTELSASKKYIATVETSCGEFQITLDPKRAPKTGGSFAALVKDGFYDGLAFHRIIAGFVVQGGDPAGTGSGGPGYTVIEKPPADLQYVHGVVAMAKRPDEKPGASGSQFFVVTGEDAGLPPEYALLGTVTDGQDVVDTISTVQTDPTTDAPVDPVVIKKITISEK